MRIFFGSLFGDDEKKVKMNPNVDAKVIVPPYSYAGPKSGGVGCREGRC